jgi:hypothetical protein
MKKGAVLFCELLLFKLYFFDKYFYMSVKNWYWLFKFFVLLLVEFMRALHCVIVKIDRFLAF